MRLENKVAAITGAGSGIGRATTELFLKEGARVVAADINAARLEQLTKELQAGDNLLTLVGNIADRTYAEQLITSAVATYGKLDILVNNAGIVDGFEAVGEVSDEIWRRVMAVNVDGPMYTSRKAVQVMQNGGVIVNIASVGGLFGGRAGVAYTVSKHAVIGLTRSVAWQYAAAGIRCVAICPGGVETNIMTSMPENTLGWQRAQPTFATALRSAKPGELAAVALFLASDEASFVNGAILTADGGWTAG